MNKVENRSIIYKDKIVVITGARKGIGKMIVDDLITQGAKVIGISRSPSDFKDDNYTHHCLDIGDNKKVQSLFRELSRDYKKLDILINNAGALTAQFAFLLTSDNAEEMVKTNLLGTFYMAREAAKLMKKNRFGRIINMGSMVATLEPAGNSVYGATKAGANTLINVMAKEFAGYNITCNTIGISAIETDMFHSAAREPIDKIIESLPINKYACSDDILNILDFFASEKSSNITAQTIYLGGVN
jgi:3-oxoacyl-[acyl-carrier protein] reductase